MAVKKSSTKRVPVVIPPSEHTISQNDISKEALKVLYRLHEAGYDAFLVGGGVRDLLLGLHPKDFDVVTNATPEEVRKLFSNSRIIGRRFKLVHVRYGREIIEVATYRGYDPEHEHHLRSNTGMILRDNVYGSLEEDALRRDFTINALYYNIADFSVVDDVGGMTDIKNRNLRVIGDPDERYREDPLRMLRAIRLSSKLNLNIDPDSKKSIKKNAELLIQIPSARLFDEFLKISMGGHAAKTFEKLEKENLFHILFPALWKLYNGPGKNAIRKFIGLALESTDQRIKEEKGVNPAFLIAVIMWPIFEDALKFHLNSGVKMYVAIARAQIDSLKNHQMPMSVPRRLMNIIEDIWLLQFQLKHTQRAKIFRTLHHQRFRAAYDFMLLRAESGEPLKNLCRWWEKFQEADKKTQDQMIKEHPLKKEVKKSE